MWQGQKVFLGMVPAGCALLAALTLAAQERPKATGPKPAAASLFANPAARDLELLSQLRTGEDLLAIGKKDAASEACDKLIKELPPSAGPGFFYRLCVLCREMNKQQQLAGVDDAWMKRFSDDTAFRNLMTTSQLLLLAKLCKETGKGEACQAVVAYAQERAKASSRPTMTFLERCDLAEIDGLSGKAAISSSHPFVPADLKKLAPVELVRLAGLYAAENAQDRLRRLQEFILSDYTADVAIAGALGAEDWYEMLRASADGRESQPTSARAKALETCLATCMDLPRLKVTQARWMLEAITAIPDKQAAVSSFEAKWLGLEDSPLVAGSQWEQAIGRALEGNMHAIETLLQEKSHSRKPTVEDYALACTVFSKCGEPEIAEGWAKKALDDMEQAGGRPEKTAYWLALVLQASKGNPDRATQDKIVKLISSLGDKSYLLPDKSYQIIARRLDGQPLREGASSGNTINLPVAKAWLWKTSDAGGLRSQIGQWHSHAAKLSGDEAARYNVALAYAAGLTTDTIKSRTAGMAYLQKALAQATTDSTRALILHEIASACIADNTPAIAFGVVESIKDQLQEPEKTDVMDLAARVRARAAKASGPTTAPDIALQMTFEETRRRAIALRDGCSIK